jgi:hypothetical protein
MVSFVGSTSWIFSPTDTSACMLYGLRVRYRSDALSGAAGERKAQWDSEESSRDDRCWSIVRYAVQAQELRCAGVRVQVVILGIYLFGTTEPKLETSELYNKHANSHTSTRATPTAT